MCKKSRSSSFPFPKKIYLKAFEHNFGLGGWDLKS